MKHIVSVDSLHPTLILDVVENAVRMKRARREDRFKFANYYGGMLHNQVMITDFFEPSTRTRLSFEAAMTYMGGHAIGTENAAEFSSFKKGESLEDNFRVVSGYCDVIVGRFLNEGDAKRASLACEVPLINGGDGKGEHPTQALIDLFSILEHFHYNDEIKILFFGDNKRSRTVQSLARLLATFDNVTKMMFVSPGHLKAEPEFIANVERITAMYGNRGPICDVRSYIGVIEQDILDDTNVVYVTRSQDERGGEGSSGLVFEPHYLKRLPKKSLILHPLPRNSELPTSIDADPRAYYFEQAKNGLYVRMALLEWLFDGATR